MIAQQYDDDLMAIAEAVGVVAPSGRPHPTVLGDLTDLTLAIALETWSMDRADDPIPYLPTDHDVCHGCGDLLCACEDQCPELERDTCGHKSRPYCGGCAPTYCRDCPPADRGEWR